MNDCPIPGARGSAKPEGGGTNGVLILGEALGDHEREAGLPFRQEAPAGSVLERAIRRSGFSRDPFVLFNVVNTQPPHNWLEGAPYEAEAIAWGMLQVDEVVVRYKPRCVLALGNVALNAATAGLSGILETRGYPVPSRWGIPVIGSLHPSFLRRGAMAYLGVLMHDIRFAVALAAVYTHPRVNSDTIPVEFWSPVLWRQVHYDIQFPLAPWNEPVVPLGYICYPNEEAARAFLAECESHPQRLIAYDIETPLSHRTKEDETDELEDVEILSIQFSIASETGIFMPWRDPFVEVARRILALGNPKVGANNWRFDAPRLRSHGCAINGVQHDLRWAWKHFQPDLSAGLQFIASFYCPQLEPWKHLAASHDTFYGIRDADATLRCL